MKTTDSREGSTSGRRPATVLESFDEARGLAGRATSLRDVVTPQSPSDPAGTEAIPFRPTERPPMAVLTVMDDGEDTGEKVRIRAGTFLIGRVDGDLVIPHDSGISARHAEIVRRPEGGKYAWYLRDLQSTNGTFVRAATVNLNQDQEVLIGRSRFRYDSGARSAHAGPDADEPPDETRKWQVPSQKELESGLPALVELTPRGPGRRYILTEPELWIGRDPERCGMLLDDPTVDMRHARAYKDSRNRWVLENLRSLNGLWVRIQEIPFDRGGLFQCGEQRFLLKILQVG
jgi:pSer/pThr/pTyr-binding forkhead associated (FHA) protein